MQLIDLINDRFGTDFNDADQLFFDQIVETAVADETLRETAAVNSKERFELTFKNLVDNLFTERMEQNEDIFIRYMNDARFSELVSQWMGAETYRRLRREVAASDPQAQPQDGDLESVAGAPRLKLVEGRPDERYVTCVPLVPLERRPAHSAAHKTSKPKTTGSGWSPNPRAG